VVSVSNLSICTFLHGCMFVLIEENVACYLSTLIDLVSVCFSQKIAKGGDCWIYVC